MNKFKPGDYVTAKSFKGCALYVVGNSKIEVEGCSIDHSPSVYESYCPYCNGEEYEIIDCDEIYDCVMVGDDQIHRIDEEDLEILDEDKFCGSCGQIGCGWH